MGLMFRGICDDCRRTCTGLQRDPKGYGLYCPSCVVRKRCEEASEAKLASHKRFVVLTDLALIAVALLVGYIIGRLVSW